MILSGSEIENCISSGDITISPFNRANLNPNSYNYRLAEHIRTSKVICLDAHTPVQWTDQPVPRDGLKLMPGRLYLGSTMEKIGSSKYVTSLIGRSSLGRLGMFMTTSADLSNLGPPHCWTLEIKVVQPLVVYPHMKIGQVSFWEPIGVIPPYLSPYTQCDDAAPAIFARVGGADAFLCDSNRSRN
jgi:dCTP deaminase